MDEESYQLQVKWIKGKEAKLKQLKAEADKPPSFKPHIYTAAAKPKRVDGHVADLTVKAGADYASRQQRARDVKLQQKEQFDRLGSVRHSKQRSLNVVLPVEVAGHAEAHSDGEEVWAEPRDHSHAARELPSDSYVLNHEDTDPTEEETLVEMLQRERREWHSERVKLVHCVHIQQMELMQRATASHERAAEIAKEFARTIEGFEERLYAVEANVQKEILAIKVLAENLKLASTGSSASVENRLSSMEKGIDIIIEKLNSTQRAPRNK